MSSILEVKNLSVEFLTRNGNIEAVSGINFTLKKGEILGIVGESGCGKSAMAKALTKLVPKGSTKLQGEVLFKGKNLLEASESTLQSIRGKEVGMIFQDPMTSLNPTLRVGEQIIEGYLKHNPKISREEAFSYAKELLHSVGISHPEIRIFEYPHTLSGGMRQKITIALALATRPELIIADEPTTALDVTIQTQILAFMKSFQESQKSSILLITHDLSVVAGFCDKVIVMYAGKIVESSSVEELFYCPKHPYTQRLLKAIPRVDLPKSHPLVPIEGTPPSLTSAFSGCAFYPRCSKAMLICKQKTPSLKQVGHACYSRCWLHEQEHHS